MEELRDKPFEENNVRFDNYADSGLVSFSSETELV